jgi:membrane protein DedA with SNARE-associated domain
MIDVLISLIPDYGLFIIFGVVALACLAMPLPSSVLVLASGAFAASGDLVLWQVLGVAFTAFVIGDQLAFLIAGSFGPRLLAWMREKPRLEPVLVKSETLLEEKGSVAVFLSHTILSPTCPYISYLCGAGGMNWPRFSVVATIGAAIWVMTYVALGFVFATQLEQVAAILSQFFGIIFAAAIVLGCLHWLRKSWRKQMREHQLKTKTQ